MLPPIWSAVRGFFGAAEWNGERIPTCFAQPDRAFAEMKRLIFVRESGAKPDLKFEEIENRPIPRPFMSVFMQHPKFDPTRFSPGTVRAYAKDRLNGTAKSMRMPRPVLAEVQVDLWCGDAGGNHIADSVTSQIDLRFMAESAYAPVDWTLAKWYRAPFNMLEHAREFGRTKIRLIDEGWTNTSDLEAGEGPKEVRLTWSGQVAAELPYRPIVGRLVREVRFAIYEGTDPDTATQIATLTSGGED